MSKVIVNSFEELQQLVGREIGKSDYMELSQKKINLFAEATEDYQWIHVDTERAAKESPFKSTIAHGYLTMSMIPYLWDQTIQVNNTERMINYGMDKMKFREPVISGQHVRMTSILKDVTNLRGAIKCSVKFYFEIQETGKKALEGLATFVYYFRPEKE